jgi:hypothetical protein
MYLKSPTVNKGLHLGPPYENPDELLVGGGVYRRLINYRGRPAGWIAYGVSKDPNRVNLWMQTYRGYIAAEDIVTYESEEAALQAAERYIEQLYGEPT